MIITKQKPFSEILELIRDDDKVFLVGCALCAATCKTGGEEQVRDAEKALRKSSKTVTGWSVLEPACSLLEIKRLYRRERKSIDEADAVLCLACGGGTQAIVDIVGDKNVYPANDTLFQGEITELSPSKARFDQKCSLCGECILAKTGSICPITRCPKGMVNGPCGGVKRGKCEVDGELDCVWMSIYDRLKALGRIDRMNKISPPRDHGRNRAPRNLIIK